MPVWEVPHAGGWPWTPALSDTPARNPGPQLTCSFQLKSARILHSPTAPPSNYPRFSCSSCFPLLSYKIHVSCLYHDAWLFLYGPSISDQRILVFGTALLSLVYKVHVSVSSCYTVLQWKVLDWTTLVKQMLSPSKHPYNSDFLLKTDRISHMLFLMFQKQSP